MTNNKDAINEQSSSGAKKGCPYSQKQNLNDGLYYPTATRDVTHKQMDGISDLVVWAPIKEGFVDAFGNVTYESRLRIVTEALNKLRRNVREFQVIEPFSDSTRRILSLLDFRIGIVERDVFGFGNPKNEGSESLRPRKYMYLTATFDGPWEPYMRQIWHPMGAFLDLVLCNCENYPPATRTPFEPYVQWVRDHSMDTGMFYLVMGQTVKDHIYLEDLERIQREETDPVERDKRISKLTVMSPDQHARQTRNHNGSEALKLALEALNVLYQLTRYYPQNSGDNKEDNFLLAATKQILNEEAYKEELDDKTLKTFIVENSKKDKKFEAIRLAMKDQLDWYDQPLVSRMVGSNEQGPDEDDGQIQKGILSSYDAGPIKHTHGAVVLLKITDLEKVKRLLNPSLWSWENTSEAFFYRNISISNYGMAKMPLTEQELKAFPKEFREGMEARAPLIGDMYSHHPQNWKLPKRYNRNLEPGAAFPPVSMTEVDLVLQFRGLSFLNNIETPTSRVVEPFIEFGTGSLSANDSTLEYLGTIDQLKDKLSSDGTGFNGLADKGNLDDPKEMVKLLLGSEQKFTNPDEDYEKILSVITEEFVRRSEDMPLQPIVLIDIVVELLIKHQDLFGVEVLSIENSTRSGVLKSSGPTPSTLDHFQFEDGISQPNIAQLKYSEETRIKNSKPMDIARGDLIYGFSNLLGDVATTDVHKKIQINGSFLAIRKISQDVKAFNKFFEDNNIPSGDVDKVASKLMGRAKDGTPLIQPTDRSDKLNGFKYDVDPDGLKCPFASHIRRANPREVIHNHKTPKILRRGMSYGKRFEEDNEGERGIIFMAYCSNLAEQYEVVQRWVNGGNSSHVGSSQTDPLFAPMPRDGTYTVKYAEEDKSGNITVNRLVKKNAFTNLEWGLYAFVPAKKSLGILRDKLSQKTIERVPVRSQRDYDVCKDLLDRIERGRRVIDDIESLETNELKRHYWKVIFEDFLTKDPSQRDVSNDVWAYISKEHGGIYRIESGVDGHDLKISKTPVILITDKEKIYKAWADHKTFSNEEIGTRLTSLFADHYIGRDPSDKKYVQEAVITNQVLLAYRSQTAYDLGYKIGRGILEKRKQSALTLFGSDKFKIELSREYFSVALAKLCEIWFGITKPVTVDNSEHQFFASGAFDADTNAIKKRLARCPGDFLATSRSSFYPRPTPAIWGYGQDHGGRLKQATDELIQAWKKAGQVEGFITKTIFDTMKEDRAFKDVRDDEFDLLGRNIIGAMIGMLPSSEASLRGAIFEWLDKDLLWRIQGDCLAKSKGNALSYEDALETIVPHLKQSMSKRPAPDLLHRVVKTNGTFEGVEIKEGETLVLSLVSAMMKDLELKNEDQGYLTVFGGNRSAGNATQGENPHACPATGMAMGYLPGILAALLQFGRITALPASLIFEISEWGEN